MHQTLAGARPLNDICAGCLAQQQTNSPRCMARPMRHLPARAICPGFFAVNSAGGLNCLTDAAWRADLDAQATLARMFAQTTTPPATRGKWKQRKARRSAARVRR